MLDIMRKHASSLPIKLALGAIIISFIFFFGYSSYRKGGRAGRVGSESQPVVSVNGWPISMSEYKFFYDQTFDRLKQSFKDQEIPDFARKLAENSTLQQLVEREVVLQQSDKLNLIVPDEEVADVIEKSNSAQGRDFDPIAYKHNFLPRFKDQFGMDYEQLVRQDLRLSNFGNMFSNVGPKLLEQDEVDYTWNFEVVKLDSQTMTNAKEIAQKLATANTKDWPKILKENKIESQILKDIKVANRSSLFESQAKLEDFKKVFAVTKEKPVLDEPIEVGNKTYIIRLVDRTEKTVTTNAPTTDFIREWLSKLIAKAKIENYLKQQQ